MCTTIRISTDGVGALCHGLIVGGIDGPFLGTEALADGFVTRRGLKSGFRPVYRNAYMPKNQLLTPVSRAKAAWL